jgi:hypothetical protein
MGLFEMIDFADMLRRMGRTRTWRLCAAQLATLAFDIHPAVRSNFGEPRFVNIVKGAA